jgi:hypothetical protein
MRTNVTIKRGMGEGTSLADVSNMDFYEVIDNGTDPELTVGDIFFKHSDDYFVFTDTGDGVVKFYFEEDDLDSVRVREFKPGDSFTVTFEE